MRPSLSERERFDLRVPLSLDLEEIGRVDGCVINDTAPLLVPSALNRRHALKTKPDSLIYFRECIPKLSRL